MMNLNDKKEFGRRLEELMLKNSWNQSELARRAEMGRDNISGYIRGRNVPNSKHLQKLANAFGISPNELYRGVISDLAENESHPTLEVLKNGMSRLRINQVIPTDAAMKIIAILNTK